MENCFKHRINRLKASLKNKNVENMIILKDENIFYLTGFYGKDSDSIFLLINGDMYLFVNFIFLEQAQKSITTDKINIILYSGDKYEKLSEILKDYNTREVGVNGSNITYVNFIKLENFLNLQDKKLLNPGKLVENLRIIKDDIEISNIKKACNITDNAYSSILNLKSSDILKFSEIKLMHEVEKKLIRFGSDGRSFDIIIASGKNSSIPHHISSREKIKDGALLMDFGCKFENYCSDITRTVFLKNNKKNNEIKKIYDIALRSQIKAIEACREGVSCSELDGLARDFIRSKGYGENFGHGLGHGVGIEVHEEPGVSCRSKTILKKNMVITVEPGIYIKGIGGVRIEDMVLVKENCCEVLYKSAKACITLG